MNYKRKRTVLLICVLLSISVNLFSFDNWGYSNQYNEDLYDTLHLFINRSIDNSVLLNIFVMENSLSFGVQLIIFSDRLASTYIPVEVHGMDDTLGTVIFQRVNDVTLICEGENVIIEAIQFGVPNLALTINGQDYYFDVSNFHEFASMYLH